MSTTTAIPMAIPIPIPMLMPMPLPTPPTLPPPVSTPHHPRTPIITIRPTTPLPTRTTILLTTTLPHLPTLMKYAADLTLLPPEPLVINHILRPLDLSPSPRLSLRLRLYRRLMRPTQMQD